MACHSRVCVCVCVWVGGWVGGCEHACMCSIPMSENTKGATTTQVIFRPASCCWASNKGVRMHVRIQSDETDSAADEEMHTWKTRQNLW